MSYRGTISNLKAHILKKHPTIDFNSISNKTVAPKRLPVQSVDIGKQNVDRGDDLQSTSKSLPDVDNTSKSGSIDFQPKTQSSIKLFVQKKMSVSLKKNIDKNLLKLFTQDYQPFSIVDDVGFKAYSKALNPSYELPSRKVIANSYIPAAYEACKTKVLGKMGTAERVCLTTDCWSSSNMESYLALTAHFINENYELESVVLDCLPIEGSHTSQNLATIIRSITDTYNISEKVLIVVSDNASNIVRAVSNLNWEHFGCYAHTINLIVQDALKIISFLQDKARHIVTFFKRSNLAMEKLIRYQKDSGNNCPKKLIQDVATRWNSTFLMLQRLVALQDAVKTALALSDRADLNLTLEEWKICSELIIVLEPFEGVTRKLCGEHFVTGSQIIVLTSGISPVCSVLSMEPYHSNVLDVVTSLQNGIATRLTNIEYSKIAGICTFLDPRFKQYAFTSPTAIEKVKDIVTKLVTQEFNKDKITQAGQKENDLEPDEPPKKKDEKSELSVWDLFDTKIGKFPQTNATSSAIMEIQRYTEENIIPRTEDPLKWWKENNHHYPYLAKIMKQHFPMVATSVPCERVFSKTGLLINDRRTRLKAKKVQELVFLKENE